MTTAIGAIVLCGGQSRRMGRPKATLPFGPETLLERVVRIVGTIAGPIVVVAAPEQDLPRLPGEVILTRDPTAHQGPLRGLATGLESITPRAELVFATATDVPFLEPRWILRLDELIGKHDIALPYVHGFHHPLAALYRRGTVLEAARRLLAEDRYRPAFLMERLPTRVVEAGELQNVDPQFGTLRNLNEPADYAAALADAGFSPPPDSMTARDR